MHLCRRPLGSLAPIIHAVIHAAALAAAWILAFAWTSPSEAQQRFDLIVRQGTVYDGLGNPGVVADVGIREGRIAAVGDLAEARGGEEIEARGMAVAPGFINMLSWATTSLLEDGRSLSDVRQGVTLEVFGEGWSMGPLNQAMKRRMLQDQGDIRFDVAWSTLAEYLEHLVDRGVSTNVASFVGATTLRVHVLGYENRRPTAEQLDQMCELARREMEAGALGVGSSLIYAPAFYADTAELAALAKVAADYGGIYVSHIRSEGNQLLPAIDEFLDILRQSGAAGEIYHLKIAGKENWGRLDEVLDKLEQARASGLRVTADMYTYTAGATGLNAAMPPWVQEGGYDRWRDRLRDPTIRERVVREMRAPTNEWENLMLMAGSPDSVLVVGFKNPDLKHLTGKSLAEIANLRGVSPEDAAIDLVIEDGSRVEAVYFLMSEENVRAKIALPWVSICSDSASMAPQDVFLLSNPHPRAYGSFARLLSKYVREEQVITLPLAIHKMTGLPAKVLGIGDRGRIEPGVWADLAVFSPETIQDHATFENPHQLATGVRDVIVNGQIVLRDERHTGARPGQVVRRQRGPTSIQTTSKVGAAVAAAVGAAVDEKHDRQPIKLSEEGHRVHRQTYVFDGHNDLPYLIRGKASSSFDEKDISQPQPDMHTDIPRLRKGNVGAQFWSVYVPAETRLRGEALQQTMEQIELVKEMTRRYPDVFELCWGHDDIVRCRQAGKIASLIGVEGGHSIEDSIENLRRLHRLGARYMTLTHSDTLAWADAATDQAQNDGLSAFGEEVVREMNRLGMLVDLSHVSVETMRDALRVTQAPVIFSHSSAQAIADHPRNVPDEILRLTARNGGVVMINFFSGFVEPESAKTMRRMFDVFREYRQKHPDRADYRRQINRWQKDNPIQPGTIHDVLDHIEHVVQVAGVDHVGIGSDYDGVSMLPAQLEDVSTYPLITQGLLDRGYAAEQIHKVMSGNILRVCRQAEQVAKRLQSGE